MRKDSPGHVRIASTTWRDHFSEQQVLAVRNISGDCLGALGYGLGPGDVSDLHLDHETTRKLRFIYQNSGLSFREILMMVKAALMQKRSLKSKYKSARVRLKVLLDKRGW